MRGGLGKVVRGPKHKKADYGTAIFLTARLMRLFGTEGPTAVEPHIEDPKSSSVFAEYP